MHRASDETRPVLAVDVATLCPRFAHALSTLSSARRYAGPLYNVTRRGDNRSLNVGVVDAGGFADKRAHDAFCSGGDCVISNVFDQSPHGNHLGRRHKLVNASRHVVTMGPQRVPVYGMYFDPGFGYHVDRTTGIATGNEPESIYAVMSGSRYNGGCCFDYGNSESDDNDDGCGAMEACVCGGREGGRVSPDA